MKKIIISALIILASLSTTMAAEKKSTYTVCDKNKKCTTYITKTALRSFTMENGEVIELDRIKEGNIVIIDTLAVRKGGDKDRDNGGGLDSGGAK